MEHSLYNIIRKARALFWGLPLWGAVGGGLVSCESDEVLITAPAADVQRVGTWVDSRDGHEYGVVRIGNQEWTTENLAYYLPTGTAGGCFTWDEKEGDYTLEDVTFDPDTVQIVLTDDDFRDVYTAVADDPAHDWLAENNVTPATLHSFLDNYLALYGQEAFTNVMTYYPIFHDALTAALDERRAALRDGQLAELEAKCRQIVTAHRDKAEAANGGYARRYGYLYSLDGARAAVPQEGGWRLPTDEDWMQLEASLGMTADEQHTLNAWRGAGAADVLKDVFATTYGGCNAYLRTNERQYIRKDQCAYYWADYETTTSEEQEVNGDGGESSVETFIYRMGIIRQMAIYSNAIWRGTTRTDNLNRNITYSVRLVRDVAPLHLPPIGGGLEDAGNMH